MTSGLAAENFPLRTRRGEPLNAEIFSAEDAEDAKIYCHVPLIAATDNHYRKFLDQAG
jgi:hypothetical protein